MNEETKQKLFDYFRLEHSVSLLESDFEEIERIVKPISFLSQEIHTNAKDKGFWENGLDLPKMLMLTVSELSEAMEADRIDKHADIKTFSMLIDSKVETEDLSYYMEVFENTIKNTVEDELADAVIRIFDIAQYMGIDLQWHIEQKMKYNKLRPHKHGKKY